MKCRVNRLHRMGFGRAYMAPGNKHNRDLFRLLTFSSHAGLACYQVECPLERHSGPLLLLLRLLLCLLKRLLTVLVLLNHLSLLQALLRRLLGRGSSIHVCVEERPLVSKRRIDREDIVCPVFAQPAGDLVHPLHQLVLALLLVQGRTHVLTLNLIPIPGALHPVMDTGIGGMVWMGWIVGQQL